MNILISGGAGYISSHITVALLENKHRVFLYDNLTSSTPQAINRINALTGTQMPFVEGDICDTALLTQLIGDEKIDLVLHAASLKQNDIANIASESLKSANIRGSASLLEAMRRTGVRQLIFSSSAAVYGISQHLLLNESHPTQPINDYGRSKLAVEAMLENLAIHEPDWRILVLRYFNVAGLHDSGLFKHDGSTSSRNLVSHIAEVARGNIPYLTIYGDHYPTVDGTFVRDYVHVMDVAEAHLGAVDYMQQHRGFVPVNVGTGQATSVLELVKTFEKVTGKTIPVRMQPAAGYDVPVSCADIMLASDLLGWEANRSLEDICLSEWLSGSAV